MFAVALDECALLSSDSQSPGKKRPFAPKVQRWIKISSVITPADTIDSLQPADISTNKAAKDFLKEYWYAQGVETQLQAGTAQNAVAED